MSSSNFAHCDYEGFNPRGQSTLKGSQTTSTTPSHVIPLSIQTFFWTRTSSFLKREWYRKRDYESACLLFEKVVVMNELHGQSDAFCAAVKQLGSRWKLVCLALPHLIHCCSIALQCRDKLRGCGSTSRIPPSIDKLFTALHWCLCDAPRTLLNNSGPAAYSQQSSIPSDTPIGNEIYPVDIIQLFVSCFCPVIDRLRQVDLLHLAPGVDLWGKLMDHEQPGLDCFAGFVKLPLTSQQFTQKTKQFQFRNLGTSSLDPSGTSITQDESSESSNMSEDISANRTSSLEKLPASSFEKDQAQRTFSDGFSKNEKRQHLNHPTFFDIAVIRCLFNPNWSEKGIKWALKYLQKRFSEIRDLEMSGSNRRATRSLSTPVPIIKVSIDNDDDYREKLCDIPEIVTEADESADGNENTDKLSVDTSTDIKIKRDDSLESEGSSSAKAKSLERQESFDCELESVSGKPVKFGLMDNVSKGFSSLGNRKKPDANVAQRENYASRNIEVLNVEVSPRSNKDRGDFLSQAKADFTFSLSPLASMPDPNEELSGSLEGFSGLFSGKTTSKTSKGSSGGGGYLEPSGTVYYIQDDGTFNFEVVLKALYVLTNRGVSQAVIELILPLLETLMSISQVGLILSRKEKKLKKKKSSEDNLLNLGTAQGTPTSNASASSNQKDNSNEQNLSVVGAMICTLTRLIREVGCFRSTMACDLRKPSFSMTARGQALTCLGKLHAVNEKQFRRSLCHFAAKHDLFEVIDFLHALLGSCQSSNYPLPEPWKKYHGDDPSGGYGTKFKVNAEEEGLEADIECAIVVSVFKTVVTRIVDVPAKTFDSNARTYIRLLMQYIRENHGDIFRMVAFSGMLDSVYDNYGSPDVMRSCFVSVRPSHCVDQSANQSSVANHLLGSRGGKGTLQGSPEVSGSVGSDNEESQKSSQKLKKGAFGAGTANVSQETCDGDSLDSASALAPMNAPSARHLARRKVIFHKASDAALSLSLVVVPPEGLSGSKEKSSLFKKFKNKLKRDGIPHNDSEKEDSRDIDDFDANSSDNFGPHSMFGRSQLGTDSFGQPMSGREKQGTAVMKPVDWVSIHVGMKRLSFLMDCCHPGNIPDPPFVAAALQLKSPVVARAAMYAECANFVHRCVKGDWPEWLRPGNSAGLPSLRRGFSSRKNDTTSSGAAGTQGRVFDFYLNATKLFFLWGEALAHKLNELLNAEAIASKNNPLLQQFIHDETTRLELRKEDDHENFLQDLLLNPTGEGCPYALKMMACLLLTEITIFMREIYPNLPKGRGRGSGRMGQTISQNRRDTDSDVTLTTGDRSDALRRGSSKDDSSMTTLDSAALGERKISFAVDDEDSNSLSSHSVISGSESRGGPAVSSSSDRQAAVTSVLRTRKVSSTRKNPTVNDGTRLLRRHQGGQGSFRHGMRRRSGSIYQGNLISHSGSISSAQQGATSTQRGSQGAEDDGDSASQLSSEECKDQDMDYDFSKTVPWVGVIVKLINGCNFECNHQAFCHVNCYQRRSRSCQRLIDALKRVYGEPMSFNLETMYSRMMSLSASAASERSVKESWASNSFPQFRRHFSSTSGSYSAASFPGPSLKTSLGSAHGDRLNSTIFENSVNELGTHNLVMNSVAPEDLDKDKGVERMVEENAMMTGFLKKQAHSLMHLPFVVMCKTAAFLPRQIFYQVIPAAWQLLMDCNLQLSSSAAALFLISGVKNHDAVSDLLRSQLGSEDPSIRIQALLRFSVLWRYRYQVWPQLEEAAVHTIKVPPPSIDFTQPSPQFGTPPLSIPVVDPPWTPHLRDKMEEAISEDKTRQRSFTAAAGATTRSSQREEHNKKIRLAEEERTREGREKFKLTQIAITNDASFEITLNQTANEQDEQGDSSETGVAAADTGQNTQSANPAGASCAGNSNTTAATGGVHHSVTATMSSASASGMGPVIHSVPLFPSAVCGAVPDMVELTDDKEVSSVDGISVREVALGVIKTCLIEDTGLFLRYYLERLTLMDKHAELLSQLRKLILCMPELCPQAAHALFNYLTGLIMYFVRNPSMHSQQATATTLSVLWMVVRYVRGLTFKDLKQTLKKEQCDPALLVTAIIPVAKKLIVTGGDSTDMPIPFNVTDDLAFDTILQDSLTSFRLDITDPENQQPLLVDKTGWIMSTNMLVRDYYSNRRGGLSELHLDVVSRETRHRRLVSQVIACKMAEIGRILISRNLLRYTQESQQKYGLFLRLEAQVNFVHSELTKLPSFPRKCLEFDLPILKGHVLKSHLLGIDAIHKQMWVWLLSTLFERMPADFAWASCDLVKFLTVYNGAIATHADESAVLRFTLAAYLTAAIRFNQTMLLKGYQHIMPVLFTMYRESKNDSIVCKSLEFIVKQFYVIHRKPFILQFLGSVAHLVYVDNPLSETIVTQDKIPSKLLYELLTCLEDDIVDPLDILDLVNYPKPLKNLDFCYRDEAPTITILEIIHLCVLTVGYAPESVRGKEMLKILEALTPHYILATKNTTKLMKNTSGAAKAELLCVHQLSSCIKGLAAVCESYSKNAFMGTSNKMDIVSSGNVRRNSSIILNSQNKSGQYGQGGSKGLGATGLPKSFLQPKQSFLFTGGKPVSGTWEPHRANLKIMPMTEVKERKYKLSLGDDEAIYREFREPRSSLLHFATICHSMCNQRVGELRRLLTEDSSKSSSSNSTNFEIIDAKTHSRLMEVALALLKVAPHDPLTLGCHGLQRYITELVPNTDWSSEANRNALNLLLKRLEKVFLKITKKHAIRRQVDWDFVSNLVKGVYLTLLKQPYVAHSASMKAFLSVALNLVLDDGSSPGGSEGMAILQLGTPLLGRINLTPPPAFISAVIRLTALQMHLLKADYPLEQILNTNCRIICGQEKAENIFINLLIPLFTHMGSNRQDCPKMRADDVSFACHTILNTMLPSSSLHHGKLANQNGHHLNIANSNGASANVVSVTVGAGSTPAAPGLSNENVTHVPKAVNNSPNPPYNPHSADSPGAMFDSFFESGFLALKFLVSCFPEELKQEWAWISACVKEMGSTLHCGIAFWDFLLFVIEEDAFLYTLLKPFIQFKMCKVLCATEPEIAFQFYIQHKINSPVKERPCKGTRLEQLGNEFRILKARTSQTVLKERLKKAEEFYNDNYRYNVPQISVQNSFKDAEVSKTSDKVNPSGDAMDTPQTNWNRRLKRVKKQLGGTIAASHLTNFSSLRHVRKKSHDVNATAAVATPPLQQNTPSSSSFRQKVDQEMSLLKSTFKAARGERRSQYTKSKHSKSDKEKQSELESSDPDENRNNLNHEKTGDILENCHLDSADSTPLKDFVVNSSGEDSEAGRSRWVLAMRRLSEQIAPYGMKPAAGVYTPVPTAETQEEASDDQLEQQTLLLDNQTTKPKQVAGSPPKPVSRNSSLKKSLIKKTSKSPVQTPKKLSFKKPFRSPSFKSKNKLDQSPGSPAKPIIGISSLPPSMVPVEPDDSSTSERRPPPLPKFVLNPIKLGESISEHHRKDFTKRSSIAESVCTIEDVENYNELATPLPPRPIMRLIHGNKTSMSGNFASRRPSQDSTQVQKQAPLQHMESLEEWSSAESMAIFSSAGGSNSNVQIIPTRKLTGGSNTASPAPPILPLAHPGSFTELKRGKTGLNQLCLGSSEVPNSVVRSKIPKDTSVPNFSEVMDQNANASNGPNSRPVSVVIEMESLLNKDSHSTTV